MRSLESVKFAEAIDMLVNAGELARMRAKAWRAPLTTTAKPLRGDEGRAGKTNDNEQRSRMNHP
jgi:hypothetical protein